MANVNVRCRLGDDEFCLSDVFRAIRSVGPTYSITDVSVEVLTGNLLIVGKRKMWSCCVRDIGGLERRKLYAQVLETNCSCVVS